MTLKNPNTARIREEMERRILHGIACEWEAASWVLNAGQAEKLRLPLFRLKDMKTRWGCWSGDKREICLSRRLVFEHSWDAVRDVLVHEMAHQYAEEALGGTQEPPHGPKFLEAARLLRADPEASGRFVPLDERLCRHSHEDRIMVRVKKLMALAESRNRHEAEAAMAKAHELIAKHNLDLLNRNRDRRFISVFLGRPALRHPREDYHLAHLLQDFYFVHGIWVSAYALEKGKMGRVLEINGTVENIKIAGYVYDFVNRFIDSQWEKYNKNKRLNRYRKTDFAVGVIEGFRAKLDSQRKERQKAPSSARPLPAALDDPLLDAYIAYRYPRTTTFSRKVSSQDDRVLNEGMRLGKKLIIHKGVAEKGGNNGRLIGGGN